MNTQELYDTAVELHHEILHNGNDDELLKKMDAVVDHIDKRRGKGVEGFKEARYGQCVSCYDSHACDEDGGAVNADGLCQACYENNNA